MKYISLSYRSQGVTVPWDWCSAVTQHACFLEDSISNYILFSSLCHFGFPCMVKFLNVSPTGDLVDGKRTGVTLFLGDAFELHLSVDGQLSQGDKRLHICGGKKQPIIFCVLLEKWWTADVWHSIPVADYLCHMHLMACLWAQSLDLINSRVRSLALLLPLITPLTSPWLWPNTTPITPAAFVATSTPTQLTSILLRKVRLYGSFGQKVWNDVFK